MISTKKVTFEKTLLHLIHLNRGYSKKGPTSRFRSKADAGEEPEHRIHSAAQNERN